MVRIRDLVAALVLAAWAGTWLGAVPPARAQQGQVWVQIEARNTLSAAEDRARHWSALLPQVSGFALASGWYAIALGPYGSEAEAQADLAALRGSGAIPGDSFVADARLLRGRFWPAGTDAPAPVVEPAAPVSEPVPAPVVTPEPETSGPAPEAPEETIADARRDEAGLSREGRMDIQRALQWSGTYASGIDGAFGPGTRASISGWQAAQGFAETGVLTPSQREALVGGWRADLAAIGLETVRDQEAGIEIDLPLGLVEFDRYTPPFAQYAAKGDSGVQIWLISQPGDQDALYALYDLIQTLAVVPSDGPRNRRPRGFDISGHNADVETWVQADLNRDQIKGFLITARAGDATRTARILQAMKSSFRASGDAVLDPGLVPLDEATRAGLLTGIEPRRPDRIGSGFYADAQGLVLTAAANVAACGKVTLDAGLDAGIVTLDEAAGYALLRPAAPLAPRGHAQLAASLPVAGSGAAIAGFSYGAALALPTMTFGRFEAPTALDGSGDRARLSLGAMEGDVGAPVLGPDGLVIGILQPRDADPARVLPEGVHFIAPAPAIAAALAASGTGLNSADPSPGMMAPEDLTALGTAMAVQVACWK